MENKTEQKIDLIRILENMWRGVRRFGLLLLLLILLCGTYFYIRAKRSYVPIYRATATFTVTSASNGMYGGSSYYNSTTAAQMEKTFPYILTSGLLSQIVAQDLGVESLPGSVSADVIEGTNLFTLEVTSRDAQKAYEVLESVIRNYPSVAEYVIGKVNMELLDSTGVPAQPYNTPDFKRSGEKGLFLGFVVAMGLLLLYAVTRKTIHTESDLKRNLNIACLGTVPKIAYKKRRKNYRQDITIYNKRISQGFLESIRILRARLEKEAAKGNYRTILFTSAAPGEGKSTVAVNLAMALAMNGRKIAVVDADLRHPTVRKVLKLEDENGKGTIDFLEGKASFEEVCKYQEKYGMYVVAGGEPRTNASELIDSPQMSKLLEKLKEVAEYVIVDSAPIGVLADTAALAGELDMAVMVVKQDFVPQYAIIESCSTLGQSGIHLAGCILNGVEAGISTSSAKNYRYYGKYGSKQEKHEKDEEKEK